MKGMGNKSHPFLLTIMEESLYYAQIKLLTTYCQACLDNKMKQKIMMFLLKDTLRKNAIALGFTEDAERFNNELLTLLNMKSCNCSPACKTCTNGYCELC